MNQPTSSESQRDPMGQSLSSDSASISAALDDAVAQLKAAAGHPIPNAADGSPLRQQFGTNPSIASQSPSDAKATLDLIESICNAADRREAMEQIVRSIAPPGTSSTVRVGIGGSNLKSLVDSRLGWIGSGSSLFDQVASQWSGRAVRNTDLVETDTKIQTLVLPSDAKAAAEDAAANQATADEATNDQSQAEQIIHHGSLRCQIWVHDDPAAVRWLQPVASTVGAVLFSRPARRIPLLSGNRNGTGSSAKVWVAGAVLLVTLIAAWPVRYRVAAQVGVETLSGRFVAMPFAARLLDVNVKPGEQVKAGQSLMQLDGRPLRLELETLETELQQAVKEHNAALASRRIADAQQAFLEQKKLRRKIDLASDRLQRLSVTSPIDGVVVSGDLRRHIGSPLELGQTLMEVAAMDSVAIELEIAEHDIGFITKGMDTRVKIDAVGGRSMDLPLQEVYPAAEMREDRNVFIGRIEVPNSDGMLRPGMRGKAVAYGPLRPWIWSWVRGIVERGLWMIGY